jgi:hypothetical protein
MEQINTSFIQKYYKDKKDKLIVFKNIFYIKLLGYFEDIDFLQRIETNNKINKFEWYFLVLMVLGISKCSDQFINKFINEYYIIYPLKQRLLMLSNFDFYLLSSNFPRIIKLIKKLSFYEQEKFIKIQLKNNLSPTQLIICKLITREQIIKYINEKQSLSCAINLYNSKYIDKNMVLEIANKSFASNKSCVYEIKTWLQLIDIFQDIDFQLNLFVFNLLNCYSLYPIKKLIEKMPSNTLNMIISNKKLCEKFIKSLVEFYDISRVKSIIKLMGKKINPTLEQKNILIHSLIKTFNKFSCEESFVYFIKIFKLTPEDVEIILKNVSNLYIVDIGKVYLVHLKQCIIDRNEYFNPELKVDLFKKFIRFKLVNENEIRYFILDNTQYLKYYYIKKYIKNFKNDYYQALTDNSSNTPNSLWILHFKFKVTNLELIEKVFSTIKPDEQDWVIYDLLSSLIKKFDLNKIHDVFLELLKRFSIKKYVISWLFNDILSLCLVDNKIENLTPEKKDVLNKFINVYKNSTITIKQIKKLYLD